MHTEDLSPFNILGLPSNFDLPHLDIHVLKLQQTEHPDRFVGNLERQREAETRFSQIVWAYEELRHFVKRAQWMLKVAGHWPLVSDFDLLEELMEIEETVSEGSLTGLELQNLCDETKHSLAENFALKDWVEAGRVYMKFAALMRLVERENISLL